VLDLNSPDTMGIHMITLLLVLTRLFFDV